jgi:hypothetical protein
VDAPYISFLHSVQNYLKILHYMLRKQITSLNALDLLSTSHVSLPVSCSWAVATASEDTGMPETGMLAGGKTTYRRRNAAEQRH